MRNHTQASRPLVDRAPPLPHWGVVLLLVLTTSVAVVAGEPKSGATFAGIARPSPRSNGAPRASDVCFSTRWPRPMNSADPHDSFTSARAFHATRLDWLYLTGNESIDKTFVAKAKEHGYLIGGTLNGSLHDTPASRSFDVGRTVDLRGEPLKDPWTKKWGMRFGCPNHPDYAKVFLDHARYALGMGVDHYQMDGVQLNEIMVAYGGCFCPYCIEGFREHLAAHSTAGQRTQWGLGELSTFNYAKFLLALGTAPNSALNVVKGPKELRDLFREFQTESGVRFLAKMHEEIDRMAGRELAYSCNANREFLTTYHRVHDFAFIEAYPFREGTPAFLYEQRLKKAQELGKSCLMTFVSDDVDHNRRFIATSYALGANVVVPWDVFTGFETPRFFGTPEQFADLFGFIRGTAAFLEGYGDACVVGAGIHDERYAAERVPVQIYAASPVLAAVRARPGGPDAAAVIHLVAATSKTTGPLRLSLDPLRFFGGRPLKMRFLTPSPYDAATHEKAADTGDYSSLVQSLELPGGRVSMVELPAVKPWGLLVVEPALDETVTPWQPGIRYDERTRFAGTLEVRLDCATPDSDIRYTLDNTKPTPDSQLYTRPLRLRDSTTVQAAAFGPNGTQSIPAVARFDRAQGQPALSPDAAQLKQSLRLWLRADSLAHALPDGAPVRSWPGVVGPEATLPDSKLYSGEMATAPTFARAGLNGRSCVQFDGLANQMVIPGFANANLAGKAFTVFLVTQSDDGDFGVCGNGGNGNGGVPRLYLTRSRFYHDTLSRSIRVGPATPSLPIVSVYRHDGDRTASARANGIPGATDHDQPVVPAFGSGGNLAMPFWSSAVNHQGDIAEVIAYDRALTGTEIQAVEQNLAIRYGIGMRPLWRALGSE